MATASRIANGDTIPRSTTGGAHRSSTARKLPMTAPADAVSRPSTVKSRNGLAANGMSATNTAATSTMKPSSAGSGRRSAIRPPSQYPSASAASTIPMRFAQTIVDEPKYGASSLEAAISVARAPIPAPNTSAPSASPPGRSPAAYLGMPRDRRRARSR